MFFSRRQAVAALAAGGVGLLGAGARAFAVRPRSKLIILLISEQFRSDYLDRFGNYFVAGGFRRLMDDGAYYPDCQMAASSFSSSGLATISTGAYPEVHGLVADAWYDRWERQPVLAGLDYLQGTTLADEAAAAGPRNRVFGVGGDLRHIQLLAGRHPEILFSMLSSGDFEARGEAAPPGWFEGFREANSPEKQKGAAWQGLGAPRTAPAMRTLSWDATRPEEFGTLYRASPFSQSAQFALLRELIAHERLGQGVGTDLLVVALDSMALLGYEVGSDSPLMREMVLHLDREIEGFLTVLDKAPGPRNYTLAFTAAHGAVDEPAERIRFAVSGETVARSINHALSAQYDVKARNGYVERYLYPFLSLRLDTLRRSFIDLREVRVQAGRAALRVPGVAGYYTADGDSSYSGEWLRRFRNSFHAVRSGDVMLAYAPRCVEDFGGGRGVSYGSLYNYETRVPLILYGSPFNGQLFDSSVESIDVAPTLAHSMGIAWPSSASGRVLGEALVPAG